MSISSTDLLDALIEDVQWLLSVGEHPARICTRLGRNPHAIEQALRRAGRDDLAAKFYGERRQER